MHFRVGYLWPSERIIQRNKKIKGKCCFLTTCITNRDCFSKFVNWLNIKIGIFQKVYGAHSQILGNSLYYGVLSFADMIQQEVGFC